MDADGNVSKHCWLSYATKPLPCDSAGHHKTDQSHDRILGVWLHGQQIYFRAGTLDHAKEKQLYNVLSGWREAVC